jgi:hypothetical protein
VGVRAIQGLLLPQYPAALLDEEVQGMIEGLEEILAPAPVAWVPKARLEYRARWRGFARIDRSGRDHHKVHPCRI